MRVTGTKIIFDFIRKHADAKVWLQAWLAEAKDAHWQSPNEIKQRFPSASVIDNTRIIFNVKGNVYRMEVHVAYKTETILVKRLGTHAEYNRWSL